MGGLDGGGLPPDVRHQQEERIGDGGAQVAKVGRHVAFLSRKGEDGGRLRQAIRTQPVGSPGRPDLAGPGRLDPERNADGLPESRASRVIPTILPPRAGWHGHPTRVLWNPGSAPTAFRSGPAGVPPPAISLKIGDANPSPKRSILLPSAWARSSTIGPDTIRRSNRRNMDGGRVSCPPVSRGFQPGGKGSE